MRAQRVLYILILIAILLVFLLVTAMDGLLSPAWPEAYAQSGITASDLAAEDNSLSVGVAGFQDRALDSGQTGTPPSPGRIWQPVELRLDSQLANQQDDSNTSRPLGPQASVDLALDDGQLESVWGVNSILLKAFQFIWLNRFTPDPAQFPFYLNQIWVMFTNETFIFPPNVHMGDAIDLVVYQDSDGDPTNGADWLATFHETVQAIDGSTWSQYNLSTPVYVSGPGDVLIAVIDRYVVSGDTSRSYPATLDEDNPQDRSWIGWWNNDPPDPAVIPPNNTFNLMTDTNAGNWLIRGYGETTDQPPPSTATNTPTQTTTATTTTTTTATATTTQTPTQTQELIERAVNLPIVIKEYPPRPTPTPTPPLAQVYVQNDTGGQLCYEVLNTGIGEKCFPGGKSFYGSFPAGTYSWKASAKCGSDSGSRSFSAGEFTHRFWCSITALQQDQR